MYYLDGLFLELKGKLVEEKRNKIFWGPKLSQQAYREQKIIIFSLAEQKLICKVTEQQKIWLKSKSPKETFSMQCKDIKENATYKHMTATGLDLVVHGVDRKVKITSVACTCTFNGQAKISRYRKLVIGTHLFIATAGFTFSNKMTMRKEEESNLFGF